MLGSGASVETAIVMSYTAGTKSLKLVIAETKPYTEKESEFQIRSTVTERTPHQQDTYHLSFAPLKRV